MKDKAVLWSCRVKENYCFVTCIKIHLTLLVGNLTCISSEVMFKVTETMKLMTSQMVLKIVLEIYTCLNENYSNILNLHLRNY